MSVIIKFNYQQLQMCRSELLSALRLVVRSFECKANTRDPRGSPEAPLRLFLKNPIRRSRADDLDLSRNAKNCFYSTMLDFIPAERSTFNCFI